MSVKLNSSFLPKERILKVSAVEEVSEWRNEERKLRKNPGEKPVDNIAKKPSNELLRNIARKVLEELLRDLKYYKTSQKDLRATKRTPKKVKKAAAEKIKKILKPSRFLS